MFLDDDISRLSTDDTEFSGGRLRMSSLIGHIKLLNLITDDTPEYEVQHRVRFYMMWIIGSMLAVDTSGCKVKLMYLPFLHDLDNVGRYAWGAATLVILYRFLYRAS